MPTGVYERKPRVARVIFACDVCGADIALLPGEVRRRLTHSGPIRFCSPACMGAANVKPGRYTDVACGFCGACFSKRTDHLRAVNYCSRTCVSASRRTADARWRDPDQIREYNRAYRDANRARLNALSLAWRRRNRDKVRRIERIRHAGRGRSRITVAAWDAIKQRFGHRCLCCGQQEPSVALERDHVVALSCGGRDVEENIQPLCRRCNAAKGASSTDYRKEL